MSNLGNKETMSKNIRLQMDLHEVSRKELCDAIGVKYTTLTDWINGNTYPRIDKIELMANYFGISKSDLIEDRGQGQNEQPEYAISFYNDEAKGAQQSSNDVYAQYFKRFTEAQERAFFEAQEHTRRLKKEQLEMLKTYIEYLQNSDGTNKNP